MKKTLILLAIAMLSIAPPTFAQEPDYEITLSKDGRTVVVEHFHPRAHTRVDTFMASLLRFVAVAVDTSFLGNKFEVWVSVEKSTGVFISKTHKEVFFALKKKDEEHDDMIVMVRNNVTHKIYAGVLGHEMGEMYLTDEKVVANGNYIYVGKDYGKFIFDSNDDVEFEYEP